MNIYTLVMGLIKRSGPSELGKRVCGGDARVD